MTAPLPANAFRREAEDVTYAMTAPGVQRWEWRHQFGSMLIEVRGNEVFVNQDKVEQLCASAMPFVAQRTDTG